MPWNNKKRDYEVIKNSRLEGTNGNKYNISPINPNDLN